MAKSISWGSSSAEAQASLPKSVLAGLINSSLIFRFNRGPVSGAARQADDSLAVRVRIGHSPCS